MKNNLNSKNIADLIAPMFAITMEMDAIIGVLLRDKFDMSLSDFKVLRAIFMLEVCTQLDIARFNQVSEAAVSKRVKSLAAEGLVEKTVSSKDKRQSVLFLTETGKKLMKQLQVAVVGNTESILTDFSTEKRQLTTTLLLEVLGSIIEHSPRKDILVKSKHPVLGLLKKCGVDNKSV